MSKNFGSKTGSKILSFYLQINELTLNSKSKPEFWNLVKIFRARTESKTQDF
jgi:hypothetical protein